MAVIHIGTRPMRSGRVTSQRNNLLYETLGRRYIRPIIVITDHPADGPESILTDPAMADYGAVIGATYAFGNDIDTVATCVDISLEETDNPFIFYGTVEYDTDRLVNAITDNPLLQPPEIRWGGTKIERPLVRDYDGIPLVNSSKEPFDPPEVTEEVRPILTITRNEPAPFPNALIYTYTDAVNSTTFNGVDIGLAKINSINSQRQVNNGIIFENVTYELEFRREGFWRYVQDKGFRDIDKKLFRDPRDNTPFSNPTLLNGRGKALTDARGTLAAMMNATTTNLQITNLAQDATFPPGPNAGTAHWYFDVRVDDEVMTVIAGYGTANWTVIRGSAGSTPATHAVNANVTLEPYYLRYRPHKFLDLNPLSLTF